MYNILNNNNNHVNDINYIRRVIVINSYLIKKKILQSLFLFSSWVEMPNTNEQFNKESDGLSIIHLNNTIVFCLIGLLYVISNISYRRRKKNDSRSSRSS